MNKIIALVCLGFVFSVSAPAFAGAQQDKMKGCNMEAKNDGLKGDERKAFMSRCLKKDYILKSKVVVPAKEEGDVASADSNEESADSAVATANQKGKMKSCNADAKAKDLKGEERKKFMSSCLKG